MKVSDCVLVISRATVRTWVHNKHRVMFDSQASPLKVNFHIKGVWLCFGDFLDHSENMEHGCIISMSSFLMPELYHSEVKIDEHV